MNEAFGVDTESMRMGAENPKDASIAFWDQAMERFDAVQLDPFAFRHAAGKTLIQFLELIGDPSGLEVLEIGCGNGHLSVYLSKMGATVTAIDTSEVAVANTKRLAELNRTDLRVLNVDAASALKGSTHYDLIVGQFILHHVEPFEEFVTILQGGLVEGGKAIFMENSARNRVLMWVRSFVVGRFGIPKFSDSEEHPLERREIEIMKQNFSRVSCSYPEFLFFRLLNPYLFRNSRRMLKIFDRLDAWVYRSFRFLRKYTYYQVLQASK